MITVNWPSDAAQADKLRRVMAHCDAHNTYPGLNRITATQVVTAGGVPTYRPATKELTIPDYSLGADAKVWAVAQNQAHERWHAFDMQCLTYAQRCDIFRIVAGHAPTMIHYWWGQEFPGSEKVAWLGATPSTPKQNAAGERLASYGEHIFWDGKRSAGSRLRYMTDRKIRKFKAYMEGLL